MKYKYDSREERGVTVNYYVDWNKDTQMVEWWVDVGTPKEGHFKAWEMQGYGIKQVEKRQKVDEFLDKPYRKLRDMILNYLLEDIDKT